MTAETIKACCADLYASDWVRLLVGDSFHPGGLALTERLAVLLELDASSRVLDLAAGRGTSALHLARAFGCRVVGLDYSSANVSQATDAAKRDGLSERVEFLQGDAEQLSALDNDSFDAVICECAYCTFPQTRSPWRASATR
jgi:ubiquinone/menaquinone biosynthesis C-methylase UbiE